MKSRVNKSKFNLFDDNVSIYEFWSFDNTCIRKYLCNTLCFDNDESDDIDNDDDEEGDSDVIYFHQEH